MQVALLNFSALTTIIFTLWFMPLVTRHANIIEAFNDCTILVLTYHLWCFTDMVRDPEVRHLLGFAFITTSLGNVAVHLILMLHESGIRAKLYYKRCTNRRKAKKKLSGKNEVD